MGWIISPSEGVTNYDNGSFKLPCSESNVTYSITYVNSEGCSSNTVTYTYVTSGSCDSPTPDCPDSCTNTFAQGVAYSTTSTTIAAFYTGHTDFTACGLVAGDNILTATWGEDWEGHTGWKTIRVTMNQNAGSTDRTCKFSVSAATTANTTCTYNYSFTQSASTECTIPNTNIMKMSDANIPSSSSTSPFTYDLAVVGLCNNYTSFTVDIDSGSYGGWAVNPTVTDRVYGLQCGPTSGRIVTAQIYGNGNTSTRSFTLKVSGSTTDGKTCTKDLSFTQDGASPCSCNSITYNGTQEADPTVPTQTIQFTLKINNTTNNIVYFDEGVINFNNGVSKTINPGCEGVNDNETKAIGMFTLYNAPDPATIASATIKASHQSNCSSYAVTSVTPDITTLTNGCTLTLTYNG